MTKAFEKYFRRLSKSDRDRILKVIIQIRDLELKGLDIKKMKGVSDVYRVRIGKFRIVFQKTEHGGEILGIDTRGDIY